MIKSMGYMVTWSRKHRGIHSGTFSPRKTQNPETRNRLGVGELDNPSWEKIEVHSYTRSKCFHPRTINTSLVLHWYTRYCTANCCSYIIGSICLFVGGRRQVTNESWNSSWVGLSVSKKHGSRVRTAVRQQYEVLPQYTGSVPSILLLRPTRTYVIICIICTLYRRIYNAYIEPHGLFQGGLLAGEAGTIFLVHWL